MWSYGRLSTCALALGLVTAVLAGCGAPTLPAVKGGTLTSAQYGFRVTYPNNWRASAYAAPTPAAGQKKTPIPYSVVITRTSGSARPAAGAVSTFTITVLDLRDTNIKAAAAKLPSDTTLRAVQLAGTAGYAGPPIEQSLPNPQISVTHTDYYVLHGAYEYQLGTDSVKGDNADADLQSMLKSFTFIGG